MPKKKSNHVRIPRNSSNRTNTPRASKTRWKRHQLRLAVVLVPSPFACQATDSPLSYRDSESKGKVRATSCWPGPQEVSRQVSSYQVRLCCSGLLPFCPSKPPSEAGGCTNLCAGSTADNAFLQPSAWKTAPAGRPQSPQICFHKACRRNASCAAPASFAKLVPVPLINFT